MVHHIVMWKWKLEIPEEQREEIANLMEKNLQSLVGKVPGLLQVEFVAKPLESSTHDIALITTLGTAEDIKNYATHPEHLYVADTFVRPYVTERACLDY